MYRVSTILCEVAFCYGIRQEETRVCSSMEIDLSQRRVSCGACLGSWKAGMHPSWSRTPYYELAFLRTAERNTGNWKKDDAAVTK